MTDFRAKLYNNYFIHNTEVDRQRAHTPKGGGGSAGPTSLAFLEQEKSRGPRQESRSPAEGEGEARSRKQGIVNRTINNLITHQIMPPLDLSCRSPMLPITPLSLRLSCQGLSSPPTCRHWTAIAAPKQIPPAQTPPQHPNHQRKTSPHPEKRKKKNTPTTTS